jgi:pimeloyl-ACP methyl ester carboxylesterase
MSFAKMAAGLSLAFSFNALAFNHGLYFHKQSLLMQSNSMKGHALKLRVDGSFRSAEVSFFDQKLNHKDPKSPTFRQRFFVDSQYADRNDSPVFYIICGEWNCAGTGSYSYVESLAKKMKGHLVALEHRFYGESLPTTKLTPEALKHLHLEAAIEDLASFQRHMMDKRGMKGKWVAFGGSYAGTLAAFYREKHPELVEGALASSAPVFMKNEFKEYDAHVAKIVNKTNCGDLVRKAVKEIEAKISTPEGAALVKKTFKATNLSNNGDFLYVVADMLAAAVQYGRDKMFCDSLANHADLVQGYANGGLAVLSAMGSTPFDISLAVAEKVDVTPEDNMRQWMWQSCREFGWFQVANGTGNESSRSSKIDLPYHNEVCKRLYMKTMGKDGALNSKWYLPLFRPESSRIIFTNGSNDPWLTLSVVEGGNPSNPDFDLFMMEGAAHCNDLRLQTNLASVSAAHASMEQIIREWVR